MELAVVPADGLNLSATVGFLESKFVEYEDNDGSWVVDTPEYTGNVSANYRRPSGIYARFDLQGKGNSWADEANTVEKKGILACKP